MKLLLNISIIFIFLFFKTSFSQEKSQKKRQFHQDNLNNFKIDNGIYNFWWSKKHEYKWFPKGDTLPYFVDDREYKGILNYGIEFSLKSRENTSFTEDQEMYFLDVYFEQCEFNPSNNTIRIEGSIKGKEYRKYDKSFVKKQNNINVFIGHKKDTINYLFLDRLRDPEIVDTSHNGKKINSHIVLDTFPSFYMKDYSYYKTNPGSERKFIIKSN